MSPLAPLLNSSSWNSWWMSKTRVSFSCTLHSIITQRVTLDTYSAIIIRREHYPVKMNNYLSEGVWKLGSPSIDSGPKQGRCIAGNLTVVCLEEEDHTDLRNAPYFLKSHRNYQLTSEPSLITTAFRTARAPDKNGLGHTCNTDVIRLFILLPPRGSTSLSLASYKLHLNNRYILESILSYRYE